MVKNKIKKEKHIIKTIHGKGNILEVDGIMYRAGKTKNKMLDGVKHLDYTEWVSFDPESHKVLSEQIAEKLEDTIPPKRVIEELLKDTPTENLKKLLKKLNNGQMAVKTTNGCLGLTFKDKKKKKSQYVSIIN